MSLATGSPSPTRIAAAPSPADISIGLAAFAGRFSAATTSVSPPLASASARAEVPARCVAVTSSAAISSERRKALATRLALRQSRNGKVVEAKRSALIEERSRVRRASRAASTAIVTLSSSQLQIARSPLPCALSAGLSQALASAIERRDRRSRGR